MAKQLNKRFKGFSKEKSLLNINNVDLSILLIDSVDGFDNQSKKRPQYTIQDI